MKYQNRLIIRIVLALIIGVFNLKIFYFLFSKLTFYLTYLNLYFYFKLFVDDFVLKGTNFVVNGAYLEFVPACTAASAYFLLTLLILLTKDIKFKDRVYMFLLGSLLILIANIIRLDILIITFSSFSKSLFESLHMLFWKVLSSIYVALVWIFLVYLFKVKRIPIYSDIKYLTKSLKRRRR